MEIAIIVIIFTFMLLVVYASYKTRHRGIYVHLKTGNKYRVTHIGKLKHPNTGQWYECVIYYSLKDANVYAREYYDFYDKFLAYDEWKHKQKEIESQKPVSDENEN